MGSSPLDVFHGCQGLAAAPKPPKTQPTPLSHIVGRVGGFASATRQRSTEEASVVAVTFPEPFGLLVSRLSADLQQRE